MVIEILAQLASEADNILSGAKCLTGGGLPALKPFTVGALGNFPYYWQNPSNLKFNHLTYGWIVANLMAKTTPAELDQSFTNYFIEALGSVSYQLSSADQNALTQAQQNAVNQQAAMLNAWNSAYGSIPSTSSPIDTIITTIAAAWASPVTSLGAMQSAGNLKLLLNTMPASGAPILPVLKAYLNALGNSISLQNAVSMNTGYVQQALAAVQSPSVSNGGLTTDNGIINPAFAVSTPLADIISGLQNSSNAITLNMLVSPSITNGYSVSVNNTSPVNVVPSEFFSLFIQNNLDYFESLVTNSANPVQVEMTFTGVTMVNYGPVSYNMATGQNWYWMQPITDAIKNGKSDVSGFKFSPVPQIDFSAAGPFGYLTGVGISNYPSVKITATGANYQSVAKAFQQTSSFNVKFLGVPLSGGNQTPYLSSSQINSINSSATLILNPPPQIIAGQTAASVGWVLGVQTNYPAYIGQ